MKNFRHWLFTLTALLCSTAQLYATGTTFDDWTSSNHEDSSTDSKTYTFTLEQPAMLKFDWSVSSESNYDILWAYVNGGQILGISGEQSGTFSQIYYAGDYVLEVTYTKDGSGSHGSDQATVFNIGLERVMAVDSLTFAKISDTEVSVVSAAEGITMANIPATVTFDSVTYNVTSIGSSAFQYRSSLISVTLPSSIETIESYAFHNCSNLRSIEIPSNTQYIDDWAFASCYALDSVSYNAINCKSAHGEVFNSSNNIRVVTIGDEVQHIPAYLFRERDNLQKVTMGNSVTKIGEHAFYGCDNLTNITLPNSVDSICTSAFDWCYRLKSISIPSNTQYIGDYAFATCQSLDSVSYNAINCKSAHGEVFYNSNNVRVVTIGDEVQHIPAYLFRERDNLQKVTMGNSVTKIGEHAFYGCDNLTNITLPNSVDSIGHNAFDCCHSLKAISIPNNTQYIGDWAFASCYALNSVSYNAINCKSAHGDVFSYSNNIRVVTIGDEVKTIPAYLFRERDNLQKVTMGSSVTKIGDGAFYSCDNLKEINIPNSVDSIGNEAFQGCYSLPVENGIRYADCYALEVIDKNQSQYTLKENTRFLGSELFRYCYYMTSVNIPEGVTAIGNYTFYDCNALTSIVLPDGVKHIGNGAFYDCDNLTSITLGTGVTTIGNEAFRNCYNLSSLTLPNGVDHIGSYAFQNCGALSTMNIPAGVTAIADNTFQYCGSLKEVTLPEGLTQIGNNAFYNCHALSSINIPSGVKSIGHQAFHDCNSLKSITLPDGLTSLGGSAFYSCDNLTHVNIPSGITTIENTTFCECYNLKELALSEGLTTIGESAFNNCHSLLELNIPSTVTTIGNWAFYNCNKLLSIKLPEGLTHVGDYTFCECRMLRNFEIPSTAEYIGYANLDAENLTIKSNATTPPTINGGFSNKLAYVPAGSGDAYRELYPNNIIIDGDGTTVTVEVTDEGTLGEEIFKQVEYMYQVNHLIVNGVVGNEDMENVRNSMSNLISIDLSGVNMQTVPNSFLYNKRSLIKAVLPSNAKEIGQQAFQYCTRLKEVVLPEGLEKINSQAFYESGLETITLPDNVSEIGGNAFQYCYQLKSINIPAGLNSIGSYVFHDCRSLESVEISEGLSNIETAAFEGCNSLKSINLPNSVTNIGSYAFKNCNSLETLTLPQELTSINYASFENCNSLRYVEIPEKVVTVGEISFQNCDGLDSIKVLGATTIQSWAFNSCDNLKKVTLPYTLTQCNNYIFNECYQLENVTCESLFPPAAEDLSPNSSCTLYVSDWTIDKYKLAGGWSGFKSIKPITGVYPAAISINDVQSLTVPEDGLPETYKPYLSIVSKYIDYWNQQAGKLTVRGDRPLTLSTFEMQQTRDANTMSVLMNKGSMSADSVVTKLSFQTNRWHFLSFPYDVKVSDIVYEGGWVIRYYDGEARAQGDYDNAWKNVPYDGVLEAGVGYIWHSESGNFEVPAMNNDNKNNIFSNETQFVQLEENISSLASDNGWNLIGNPYPCYFDTRYMSFTSPITVCTDGYNYDAHSPVDDSYILSPLEAFFVQCSAGNSLIDFLEEGRQINASVRTMSAPSRVRGMNSNRSVYNLYLKSEDYTDRTRFVVNEEASCNYEIACDAAKFMSEDPMTAQLFTIEQNERMAINERPMGNGEIALGIHIGKAGSYTLSLDARTMDNEVVLVDHFTGKEIDILASDYTFTSEIGTFTDRFSIRMKAGVVDEIGNVSDATVKVAAAKGAINIYNATSPVQVYNAAGALIATQSGNVVTVEVTPGVYVIKIGTEAYKVSVVD